MIKFRLGTLQQKLFYRAEKVMWDNPEEIKNLDEENSNINISIDLEFGRLYEEQMPNIDPANKKIIQRFKKDLKDGFIYDDHFSNDDTEYLDQVSKPGKYLVYTKRINGPDRFSYMIYKPSLKQKKENLYEIKVKIVVYSVKGHLKPNGQPYFEIR